MDAIKELSINGQPRAIDAHPDRTLLSVLRDDLDLTGSKYGCGEGRCGACTVLLDGEPTHACLTRVSAAAGKQIRTIEGLAIGEKLHPLQQAFLDNNALQCAYCTSGMLMTASALLSHKPDPTREEIIAGMNGNICRCGVYGRIVAAIEQAAKQMKGAAR